MTVCWHNWTNFDLVRLCTNDSDLQGKFKPEWLNLPRILDVYLAVEASVTAALFLQEAQSR